MCSLLQENLFLLLEEGVGGLVDLVDKIVNLLLRRLLLLLLRCLVDLRWEILREARASFSHVLRTHEEVLRVHDA